MGVNVVRHEAATPPGNPLRSAAFSERTSEVAMPSTVIEDFGYDPEHRTLSVRFRPSGRRYDYFGVPSDEYDALRRATSKGRYFNRYIRDQYDCALVEEPEPAPLLRP